VSGRDSEPLSAFFPSIDRNLIRDLDRQLRGTHSPVEAAHDAPAEDQQPALRPNIAGVLEAVEHAASSMTSMTTRIQELEAHGYGLVTANQRLQSQVDERIRLQEAAEANARAEAERAQRAELFAAHHVARVNALEQELALALGDLAKVTDAITNVLGLPDRSGA
jgi:conjugal transfer/entry exclusion protein